MAKVTAPLLSLGASGQLGKGITFSSWRGIKTARQYVKPSNPKTVAQQLTRTTFAFIREAYKLMPAGGRAPFGAFAEGRKFTGMNAFVGENLRVLRGEAGLANFIASPGARGGLAPDSVAIAPGTNAGEIDVDTVNPAAPEGWSLEAMVVVALKDQDPSGILDGPIIVDEDTATYNTVTLTGLEAGVDYAVAAFLEWQKPDGKTAYSVSQTSVVTATA